MNHKNIEKIVLETLNEMGIYIDSSCLLPCENDALPPGDIDLHDYITDSIMFISFIVELEKRFGLEFPDELLFSDTLTSLSGFSYLLAEIINNGKEDGDEKRTKETEA